MRSTVTAVLLIQDPVLLPGSLCQSSTGREEGTKTGGEPLSLLLHHWRGEKNDIPGNLLLPADSLSTPASLSSLYLTGRPGKPLSCSPWVRTRRRTRAERKATKHMSKANKEGRDREREGGRDGRRDGAPRVSTQDSRENVGQP